MMGEIFYGVDDEDPSYSLKDQYSDLEAYSDLELQFLAEECAADYHRNHDGWEAEFPIEIYIFKKETDTECFRAFSVDREHEPRFSAQELVD